MADLLAAGHREVICSPRDIFCVPVLPARSAIKRLPWINTGLLHMQSTHGAAHNNQSGKKKERADNIEGRKQGQTVGLVCLLFVVVCFIKWQ